jgi:hypothetical protein
VRHPPSVSRTSLNHHAFRPKVITGSIERRGPIRCIEVKAGLNVRRLGMRHLAPLALLELSRVVLSWLRSEAEDPEDRQRRYARQQAVLDLLMFCEALRRSHAAKGRPDELAAFRAKVADALGGLAL